MFGLAIGQAANANQSIRGSASGYTPTSITVSGVKYKCWKFTGAATFVIDKGAASLEYLAAGGGGGGGRAGNGTIYAYYAFGTGGGGGGVAVTGSAGGVPGSHSVVIGAGGATNVYGNSSSFGLGTINAFIFASGGGGGAYVTIPGMVGAEHYSIRCGGGVAYVSNYPGSGSTKRDYGGAGYYLGGNGSYYAGGNPAMAAGGGGAGANAVGNDASYTINGYTITGGTGGVGIQSSITGTNTYYGGGGGGGVATARDSSTAVTRTSGQGGSGGGGYGGYSYVLTNGGTGVVDGDPKAGTVNTGGGGGGRGWAPAPSSIAVALDGANGGSGIVIIRYVDQ